VTVAIVSAVIGMALAGAIFYLVRRGHLHGSYALWWLAVALAALVIGVFPHLIDRLGEIIGIAYPPILAIIVGMGLILIRMLLMDVDRSRQERTVRRLTQRLGILDQELGEARAKLDARSDAPTAPAPSRKSAQVITLPKSGAEN
jgi:hypothetical protein